VNYDNKLWHIFHNTRNTYVLKTSIFVFGVMVNENQRNATLMNALAIAPQERSDKTWTTIALDSRALESRGTCLTDQCNLLSAN